MFFTCSHILLNTFSKFQFSFLVTESYAKGFVDALNALHRSGMAYNVVTTPGQGNGGFPINGANGQNRTWTVFFLKVLRFLIEFFDRWLISSYPTGVVDDFFVKWWHWVWLNNRLLWTIDWSHLHGLVSWHFSCYLPFSFSSIFHNAKPTAIPSAPVNAAPRSTRPTPAATAAHNERTHHHNAAPTAQSRALLPLRLARSLRPPDRALRRRRWPRLLKIFQRHQLHIGPHGDPPQHGQSVQDEAGTETGAESAGRRQVSDAQIGADRAAGRAGEGAQGAERGVSGHGSASSRGFGQFEAGTGESFTVRLWTRASAAYFALLAAASTAGDAGAMILPTLGDDDWQILSFGRSLFFQFTSPVQNCRWKFVFWIIISEIFIFFWSSSVLHIFFIPNSYYTSYNFCWKFNRFLCVCCDLKMTDFLFGLFFPEKGVYGSSVFSFLFSSFFLSHFGTYPKSVFFCTYLQATLSSSSSSRFLRILLEENWMHQNWPVFLVVKKYWSRFSCRCSDLDAFSRIRVEEFRYNK